MILKTLKSFVVGTACLAAFAPLGSSQWTTETVPTPRGNVAMTATTNGKVFIAGGSSAGVSYSNVLDIFDEATGTWTSTTLPKPLRYHSAASVGTSAFFGNGLQDGSGVPPGEVYEYDTLTSTITTHLIANGQWTGAMASVGQYLLVIGGLDAGFGTLSDVNVYDTVTKTWSILHLPVPVQDPGVTAVGNLVLVVGGKDALTAPIDNVQWIDPAAGTTGQLAPLPTAAVLPAVGSLGPKAWFAGGITSAGATSQLITYDDRFGTQTATTMPIALGAGAGAAVPVGNRLVVGVGQTAVLIEADGSMSTLNFPVNQFNQTGAGTGNKAYFAGGLDGSTFATLSEMFVYTNPDLLTADVADIPLSLGGRANFEFHAGAPEAGKSFVLLYSASGTAPGFVFDGQLIPLNVDTLVIKSIVHPGAPPLYDAAGVLGPDGIAKPFFDIPPGLNPGLAGITLSFAAVSYDLLSSPLVSVVSNPQSFIFTP